MGAQGSRPLLIWNFCWKNLALAKNRSISFSSGIALASWTGGLKKKSLSRRPRSGRAGPAKNGSQWASRKWANLISISAPRLASQRRQKPALKNKITKLILLKFCHVDRTKKFIVIFLFKYKKPLPNTLFVYFRIKWSKYQGLRIFNGLIWVDYIFW